MKAALEHKAHWRANRRFYYIRRCLSSGSGFTMVEVAAVLVLLGAGIITLIMFFGPAVRIFASGRHRMLMQQDADYALSAINLNIREAHSLAIPTAQTLVLSDIEGSNIYSHRYYLDTNRLLHRDRNGATSVLLPLSAWYRVSALSFDQVYTLRGATTNLTLQRLYQGTPEETFIASITGVKRFRN